MFLTKIGRSPVYADVEVLNYMLNLNWLLGCVRLLRIKCVKEAEIISFKEAENLESYM